MSVEYSFVLGVKGISVITPEIRDALCDSGCSDAALSTRSGMLHLAFARVADSPSEAVKSAIADVERANIGGNVVHVY